MWIFFELSNDEINEQFSKLGNYNRRRYRLRQFRRLLFVVHRNAPITSIDTEVILNSWKEFNAVFFAELFQRNNMNSLFRGMSIWEMRKKRKKYLKIDFLHREGASPASTLKMISFGECYLIFVRHKTMRHVDATIYEHRGTTTESV